MEMFNDGDRVILCHFAGTELAIFEGERGEITGESFATIVNDRYVEGYKVKLPSKGVIISVDVNNLKRDRGDMDTPVAWKDCDWMPEELRA
jgi:hypothetical protein